MRMFAKSARRSHVIIKRGGAGKWRWQLRIDGSVSALPNISRGHATPEAAAEDWLRVSGAVGADPRIRIKIVD